MESDPVAVALKFGFLAVLYLFLFWVARSALRELRGTTAPAPEATGFYAVDDRGGRGASDAWLVVKKGGGLVVGERFDLFGGTSIGRSTDEAYRTDTGRQRQANEDALFARPPLFAVADGMGGAQAGEVASRIATEALDESKAGQEAPERYLRAVAEAANQRIHGLAQRDASRSGMGTTLTAVLIGDDEISIGHVGDSRAYLYRDGELRRLDRK